MDRKQQRGGSGGSGSGGAAGGPPSRRTPVKVSGGSRFPIVPIGIGVGVVVVVALLVYLVSQAGNSASVAGADKAAADSSSSIPGTFIPSQGRGHFSYQFSLTRTPMPFCSGVAWSGAPEGQPSPTPGSPTPSPVVTGSPEAAITDSHGNVLIVTPAPTDCRASNPPSSGQHLNVQNGVDVGGGNLIKIPPDPDVYPPEVVIPRDAIAHILEHAGVFLGYNCKDGDSACQDVVQQLTDLANDRIDNHHDRVVMARDPDLVEGTIGMSSWTRELTIATTDWDARKGDVTAFISKNSCRVDLEGFCK
jgi:hypothetical protein